MKKKEGGEHMGTEGRERGERREGTLWRRRRRRDGDQIQRWKREGGGEDACAPCWLALLTRSVPRCCRSCRGPAPSPEAFPIP